MNPFLEKILINYPYLAATALFLIGIATVLTRTNLLKKLIGINIMESAIFLMFIAAGNIRGGLVPILEDGVAEGIYVNPLPSALMLTGIVVSVSVSAFALALILRLYRSYGTIDAHQIAELRKVVNEK